MLGLVSHGDCFDERDGLVGGTTNPRLTSISVTAKPMPLAPPGGSVSGVVVEYGMGRRTCEESGFAFVCHLASARCENLRIEKSNVS